MTPRATSIVVKVNDEPRTFEAPATLEAVLRDSGLSERRGIAVAVNEVVVPRPQWTERVLVDGERILIIQATQGG